MAITAAQRQNKITNARAAVLAGTGRQLTLVMVNTNMVFRSPKYYQELRKYRKEKELRERNNLDQAISGKNSTEGKTRSPGPGLKLQAPSSSKNKQQASSSKLIKK